MSDTDSSTTVTNADSGGIHSSPTNCGATISNLTNPNQTDPSLTDPSLTDPNLTDPNQTIPVWPIPATQNAEQKNNSYIITKMFKVEVVACFYLEIQAHLHFLEKGEFVAHLHNPLCHTFCPLGLVRSYLQQYCSQPLAPLGRWKSSLRLSSTI